MGEDPERMEGVSALQALADRVAQGAPLPLDAIDVVLSSHDLITIGMMADEVRRGRHGTATTFVRVFEVHVDAIPASLPSNVSAGEFRIVGRPRSVDSAVAAVEATRRLAHALPLTAFTLADLVALNSPSNDVFAALRTAGLDGIADVSVDAASDPRAAIGAARSAGLTVQRVTVQSPTTDPIAMLKQVVDLQRSVGGIRAFAPLPRLLSVSNPTTGYDDVKLVAMARLFVTDIESIQVDWPLYGPKLAQVALTVGADDVDGVAAVESGALGARRAAIEEIRRNVAAAGLEPFERDGLFQRVPVAAGVDRGQAE
jgi:hypothetical protein